MNEDKLELEFEGGTVDYNDFPPFKERNTTHLYLLSDYALHRISMNQNYILLIDGYVGTGKTMASISLAEDIDSDFNIGRIAFNLEDMESIINLKLPEGSAIIWKEMENNISRIEHQQIIKRMPQIFETFRKNKWILIIVVENANAINHNIRAMTHGFATTTMEHGGLGWIIYYNVFLDRINKKLHHRYLRIENEDGKINIIRGRDAGCPNMKFSLPSKHLIAEYKKKIGLSKESDS